LEKSAHGASTHKGALLYIFLAVHSTMHISHNITLAF